MSQSRGKLKQIMKLDTINGYPVPDQKVMSDSLTRYFNLAQTVDGISNVGKTEDFENMIFSFSCDFISVNALNNLAVVLDRGKPGKSVPRIQDKHYKYDLITREFYREGGYKIKSEYDKLKAIDKAIFKAAKYTSIVRSDANIVSVENESAILSPSGKAVMLKFSIMDLIEEKKNITNKITLDQ